jgi:Sulfotransferase family
MVFGTRHEQDLAEIKAFARELDERVQECLGQLERIEETQDAALGRVGRRPRAARQPAVGDAREASSVVDGGDAGPIVAFVHIPKTAGGTVTSMFAAAYSKQGIGKTGNYARGPEKTERKIARRPGGWEEWQRRGGRVSVGHTPYGLFREHLPADTRYMTFLREPVDRVLSHYYRHIQIQDPKRAASYVPEPWTPEQGGKVRAASIEQALVDMRLPQINNLATRFLCGHRYPMGELPASAVDDAKENLRGFAFIGIQERFEESLVLLQRMLGLTSLPYEDRHVSVEGRRPGVDEITDEHRALIEEHNQLDAELYRFGLGLFEEAVAAATDEGFTADVEALRAQNAAARQAEWAQVVGVQRD